MRHRLSAFFIAACTALLTSRSGATEPRCLDFKLSELASFDPLELREHKEQRRWVERVWTSLHTTAESLGGQGIRARMVLMPPVVAGIRPPPTARSCPSQGTIYLSHSLVEKAYGDRRATPESKGLGEDLLAFVIAHEIAHWRFDRDERGLEEGVCPTTDLGIEADADLSAVFLMGLSRRPDGPGSGRTERFSPEALAKVDAVSALFIQEHGWPPDCGAIGKRRERFQAALKAFDEFQALFDVATVLALAPDELASSDLVVRALEHLDYQLNEVRPGRDFAALPELKLLRAVVHIERAAATRTWVPVAASGLQPALGELTFIPLLPNRPALSLGRPLGPATKGPSVSPTREIALARECLSEAARLGVSRSVIEGARAACEFLEGHYENARHHLTLFEVALSGERIVRTRAIRDLLIENRSLIELTETFDEHPEGLGSADLANLDVALSAIGQASAARSAVFAWREQADHLPVTNPSRRDERKSSPVLLQALAGWDTARTTHRQDLEANGRCFVEGKTQCSLWVSRVLTGTTSITNVLGLPLDGPTIYLTELRLSSPETLALSDWDNTCTSLERVATSSIGESIHRALCEPHDSWRSTSWLLWSVGSKVTRVVRLDQISRSR